MARDVLDEVGAAHLAEMPCATMSGGQFQMILIVASTVITASVISMCGQVGWVGLLVPHCARMLCGQNNRAVIPVSLLLGSALMIVIDTLARSLSASEIPISILTAIIGAPFFIVLLRRTGGAR